MFFTTAKSSAHEGHHVAQKNSNIGFFCSFKWLNVRALPSIVFTEKSGGICPFSIPITGFAVCICAFDSTLLPLMESAFGWLQAFKTNAANKNIPIMQ